MHTTPGSFFSWFSASTTGRCTEAARGVVHAAARKRLVTASCYKRILAPVLPLVFLGVWRAPDAVPRQAAEKQIELRAARAERGDAAAAAEQTASMCCNSFEAEVVTEVYKTHAGESRVGAARVAFLKYM